MIAGSCQAGSAAASSAHDDFETGKLMKHDQDHRNETHGLGLFNHYFVVVILSEEKSVEQTSTSTSNPESSKYSFLLKPVDKSLIIENANSYFYTDD